MSDTLPHPRGTPIPCLLEVKNYLYNYFAYKHLTRSYFHLELASLAYLGLRII